MRLLGWTLNQSDILIRRDQDTDTHRGKTSCLPGWAQGEGSHLQAEGRPWKEQTLDSRTEKIPFHDLSHPDSGTLLWQPEQTDRGLASHTDKFSLIQLCSAPGSVPPGSSPSILSCLPSVQARSLQPLRVCAIPPSESQLSLGSLCCDLLLVTGLVARGKEGTDPGVYILRWGSLCTVSSSKGEALVNREGGFFWSFREFRGL